MRKLGLVIAVTAAACSGVALAGEVKQEKKVTAPVVKGTTMSDAQMDKVTAGDPGNGKGDGLAYAWGILKDPGTAAWAVQGFKGNAANKLQ